MNPQTQHTDAKDGPLVRAWLFGLCALIFVMIMIGGATRLTDSGLSITEWQPIVGIVPPLTEAAWQEAFEKYRQIPEYQIVNKGMSIDEFKVIYWWEWTHRFLGRLIGFAFIAPFVWFYARGRLSRSVVPKLLFMFVLGGLQGLLGWYMVMSGLVERTDVSQYRLAAHLSAAVLIFGYIFWIALRMGESDERAAQAEPGLRLSALGLTAAVFLQIALGGLVAGLDAGQGYNTWPLIEGAFIPQGLGAMSPWYLNLFENALTVQFNHRMVAYALVLWALGHGFRVSSRFWQGPIVTSAVYLLAAIWAQAALGIVTLLAKAPFDLALAHQAMAIVVFVLALVHLSRLLPAPAPDRR